jgi:eukaryotic-like serine/threonine-protein kinase
VDSERWTTLRRLFDEVVEARPADPSAFLRERAEGDEPLVAEVLALLRSDARGDTPLDTPVPVGVALGAYGFRDALESHEVPDADVSPYRLVALVGRGGMGAVYTAVRTDGELERTVALKLVHAGLDSDDLLRRFADEQRILASLEHPNIARLYDVGRAGDGRPFLVMEHVSGEPIHHWSDRQGLDVKQRIELFLQVCDAVAYAHQGLVVHRDLKPSNILVTAAGTVKLLDFGIAKLTSPHASSHETLTGARMMTPEYASPEQLRGDVLSTASDVYSLGVVLHELLTGMRPVEGWKRALQRALTPDSAGPLPKPSSRVTRPNEAAEATGAQGPLGSERISGRVTGERIARTLRGDLDQILLKALHPAPRDRYADVASFAGDLRAYLEGRPVSAQPPSVTYRVRKFVGRRTGGVVASALVVLSLLFGAATFAWQSRRVVEERDLAVAVSDFLEDLFRAPDPRTGLVQDTTRMVDFLAVAEEQVRTGLTDQPRPRARLLLTLGIVYRNLARRDLAVPVLREAVEAHEAAYRGRHPDAVEARRLLGLSLAEGGDLEAGLDQLEGALDVQLDLEGPGAAATARLHETIGRLYAVNRRNSEAIPWLERALAARRVQQDVGPEALSSSLNLLGSVLAQEGRSAEAAPYLEEAADLLQAAGADLQPGLRQADEGVIRGNLTQVLTSLGRYDDAQVQALRAWTLLDSAFTGAQPAKASHLARLATLASLRSEGDPARVREADSLFTAALEMERLLPRQPGGLTFRLSAYGRALRAWRRFDEAEATFREALAEAEADFGADHVLTASARSDWGRSLVEVGRIEEGLEQTTSAYEVVARSAPPGSAALLSAGIAHARALRADGRTLAARLLLDELRAPAARVLGSDHPLLGAIDELTEELGAP